MTHTTCLNDKDSLNCKVYFAFLQMVMNAVAFLSLYLLISVSRGQENRSCPLGCICSRCDAHHELINLRCNFTRLSNTLLQNISTCSLWVPYVSNFETSLTFSPSPQLLTQSRWTPGCFLCFERYLYCWMFSLLNTHSCMWYSSPQYYTSVLRSPFPFFLIFLNLGPNPWRWYMPTYS